MVRVQNKVTMGLKVLQYYTTKKWDFKNTNMTKLYSSMDDRDKEIFNFDCMTIDWHEYIRNYIYGVRTYLLNEPPSTLPQARKLLKRLYYLDKLVTFIFYGFLLWLIWTNLDVIGSSVHFVFEQSLDIQYTNVVASNDNSLSWGESIERGKAEFYRNPLCFSLWYPKGSIKSNYFHHLFCVIFFHYLPAYFIDFLLVIFRKKPFMVRVQNKVTMGLKVLQYYTTKKWDFKNTNMTKLYSSMDDRDKEIFNFDCMTIDWHEYIRNYIYGVRTYLLNEPPSTLPQARKLLKRLYYLDKLVTFIFYGFLLWLIWTNLDVIGSSVHFVFEQSKNLLTKSSS
uniref:Fatty acyl-CoA reductase C-terminal domain-containing protein n=2 Tax=Lutzomyia longipalpis TaxID=7200 RepID=A0A1B0GK99_LUTLO